jgi:hypothetical protein
VTHRKNISYGDFLCLCLTNLCQNKVFWIATLCSSETGRHFRGTHSLHLQGWRVSQARNQQKQMALMEQHGVTTQKTVLLIVTAVRTSNSTNLWEFPSGRYLFDLHYIILLSIARSPKWFLFITSNMHTTVPIHLILLDLIGLSWRTTSQQYTCVYNCSSLHIRRMSLHPQQCHGDKEPTT